jgi:hypothetical protein
MIPRVSRKQTQRPHWTRDAQKEQPWMNLWSLLKAVEKFVFFKAKGTKFFGIHTDEQSGNFSDVPLVRNTSASRRDHTCTWQENRAK